jgi:hyperosmotically inducible protein
MRRNHLALALAAVLAAGSTFGPPSVRAEMPDAWITTKAKMALLTTEGVSGTAVNVDTTGGEVTLHGKVDSNAEKVKAEDTVKAIDGVKGVKNLLQVVSERREDAVEASDEQIEEQVDAALDASAATASVDVRSVNNGVVLLGGDVKTLTDHLRAIEIASKVPGVRRVETEIKSPDKLANVAR